jgi:hypothetical protein
VHLVQLLLPLFDNEGRRIARERFDEVREELTERFGGVTAYVRSPAEGTWKEDGGAVDRDDVVMCEVMVDHLDRDWWAQWRVRLEALFGQRELLVRAFPVERL